MCKTHSITNNNNNNNNNNNRRAIPAITGDQEVA